MPTRIHFREGRDSNQNVAVAVVGGSFVERAATGVQPAPDASQRVVGWVPYDAPVGARVPVYWDKIVPCTASGAIAPGQRVVTAANNRVRAHVPASDNAAAIVGFNNGGSVADGQAVNIVAGSN